MTIEVFLTDDTLSDLEAIGDYIAATDSPQQANYVLGKIEDAYLGLYDLPERGVYPKELLDLGIRDYREIFFKPYRIIYRLQGERVDVYLIADGRRDMQSLLQRRLLSG